MEINLAFGIEGGELPYPDDAVESILHAEEVIEIGPADASEVALVLQFKVGDTILQFAGKGVDGGVLAGKALDALLLCNHQTAPPDRRGNGHGEKGEEERKPGSEGRHGRAFSHRRGLGINARISQRAIPCARGQSSPFRSVATSPRRGRVC